jgi:hypothetical protein
MGNEIGSFCLFAIAVISPFIVSSRLSCADEFHAGTFHEVANAMGMPQKRPTSSGISLVLDNVLSQQ